MSLQVCAQGLRGQRGGIAIEFALVAVFLVPLILGIVDVARAFYGYDVLVKSVRAAARYVATEPAGAGAAGARCIILTGSPVVAGGRCSVGQTQLPGLDDAGVQITILLPSDLNSPLNDVVTGSGTVDLVTVSVSGYPMGRLTPLLFPDLVLGPISATVPYVSF
jgi:TadE-like protein